MHVYINRIVSNCDLGGFRYGFCVGQFDDIFNQVMDIYIKELCTVVKVNPVIDSQLTDSDVCGIFWLLRVLTRLCFHT